MKKIKCHILEDEPLAAELLADYIQQVPYLELNGISNNAIKAQVFLKENKVDLLFLDLHLPSIKGFEFLKTLVNPPAVIVTTAYAQYALEGYELNVVDYLVKPIPLHRFLQAVSKVSVGEADIASASKPIYFKAQRKSVSVLPNEILYIESQRDYVHIHLDDRIISCKQTLQDTGKKLSEEQFLRIHKSFIIAKRKIDSWNKRVVVVKGKELPIGRSYKNEVISVLQQSSA
ncbi:MAG: LytTR family DNA-binding domain-containing protein [Bacteroidota bacterium]